MEFEEKTLSSKCVYNGLVMDVYLDDIELADGKQSKREVFKHPGGVVIVAEKDSTTILMVKQYRYPTKEISIELPAGKLEKGENPDEAAKRELEEETGYIAKTWKSLGYIYTTPGICDEKLRLYYAKDLVYTKPNPDEGEIIQALEYNIDNIFQMIKNEEINDSKTICGLFKAYKL